jgi:hypothetical protein
MSQSFYIFLFAAIISCIPCFLDHRETLKNLIESNGQTKFKHGLRLFLLWIIPISFLIATILSEVESETAASVSNRTILGVSNQLAQAQMQINLQSNDLKIVKTEYGDATNALAEATRINAENTRRTIKTEDRLKFIQLLKNVTNKGEVGVFITDGCGDETTKYAQNIRDMIVAAGFDSGKHCGVQTGPLLSGIYICVHSQDTQPPFSGPIQKALYAIGISTTGQYLADVPPKTVRIYVFPK